MKFDKIPETTFEEIQLNAGVLLNDFDPTTAKMVLNDIIAATSGGNSFNATFDTVDYGDDIDNAPKNMKELKQLTKWNIEMSGTFVTVNPNSVKRLIAAADVDSEKSGHIIPRNDFKDEDFKDLWWVGDYSNKHDENDGGFIAIHMMNTLSTGGFSMQSTDGGKGTFAYTFTAHYTIEDQNKVPFEVFVQASPKTELEGE